MLKKSFFLTFILVILCAIGVKADDNYVIDNANIFKNPDLLVQNSEKFLENYNIGLYYYTVEVSSQEDFEKVMEEYKTSKTIDFVLFYIAKDTGNVGIYTSDDLSTLITDVNKIVLLKSMEIDFNEGNFEQAMICASNNLSEIIDDYDESKIENEKLELDLETKNRQKLFSIGGMILFASIFVINLVYLIKDNKKKRENSDDLKEE